MFLYDIASNDISLGIELQPLNTKDFTPIEIPEESETQYATIGVLKYIIGQ